MIVGAQARLSEMQPRYAGVRPSPRAHGLAVSSGVKLHGGFTRCQSRHRSDARRLFLTALKERVPSTMAEPDDLTELVDHPSETQAVEYKAELDLSNNVSKAKFARHIAALSNHGGGHLVFGFNNDLTRAAQTEFPHVD